MFQSIRAVEPCHFRRDVKVLDSQLNPISFDLNPAPIHFMKVSFQPNGKYKFVMVKLTDKIVRTMILVEPPINIKAQTFIFSL